MKRNYIGTTAYGSQVIVYELDEAVDVLRILLKASDAVPNYNFADDPRHFMRYYVNEGKRYLIVGEVEKNDNSLPIKGLREVGACSMEEDLKDVYEGKNIFETITGLYAINLNGIVHDADNLEEVLTLMSPEHDFNMDLGEMSHMSWKPLINGDNCYILAPVCTPTNDPSGSSWDYKEIDGVKYKLY